MSKELETLAEESIDTKIEETAELETDRPVKEDSKKEDSRKEVAEKEGSDKAAKSSETKVNEKATKTKESAKTLKNEETAQPTQTIQNESQPSVISPSTKYIQNVKVYTKPSKASSYRILSRNFTICERFGEFTKVRYVKPGFGIVSGYIEGAQV